MPIYAPVTRWFARQAITDPTITQIDVAQDFRLSDTFSLSTFDGLIAVEVVRGVDGSRVLALWRNRTARDLRQTTLATALGGTISWTGDVLEVRQPRRWWPTSAGDALLKTGALIGAVTVLMGVLSWWFAFPRVTFAIPDVQPVNAGVGEPVTFSVAALNNDRSNAADVALAVEGAPLAAVSLSTPILGVPPGGREVAFVTATSPQAGDIEIAIATATKAGLFMPRAHHTVKAKVRVWRPVDTVPLERYQAKGASERLLIFDGAVATGDHLAKALRCESVIANAPQTLRFASAIPSIDGGGRPVESRGADARTIAIRWSLAIRRRFAWERVRLHLENNGPVSQLAVPNITPTLDCEVVRQ